MAQAIQIIINPAAGSGSARKHIPQLTTLANQAQLDAILHLTQSRGHAVQLAKQAAEQGCQLIVAAGGDGTVNEVINGMLQARGDDWDSSLSAPTANFPALGVLPIGRGNDFAHGIGAPLELESAVNNLLIGKRRPIDIGWVQGGLVPEGRYFGNCVGIGFDAMTTIQVTRLPKFGGFFSFFLAVLKTILVFHKGPTVKLQFNGGEETFQALMVSVMNGKRLGGGFLLAPNGEPDDFVFDMCMAHQVSRMEILRILPMFLKGTQEQHPMVASRQTTEVIVDAIQGSLPAHMDGEIISIEDKKLEIKLLPHQIDVIVPDTKDVQ